MSQLANYRSIIFGQVLISIASLLLLSDAALAWGAPEVPGLPTRPATPIYKAPNNRPHLIEAEAIQDALPLPSDGWFSPGGECGVGYVEHRFYENFHVISTSDWYRNGGDLDYAKKDLLIGYTVRSECPTGTFATQYEMGSYITREFECPECYGFQEQLWQFGPTEAPWLHCNGGLDCQKNGSCKVGNPVIPTDGRKWLSETDLQLPGGLEFVRIYDSTRHSEWAHSKVLGNGWIHSYERRLLVIETGTISSVQRFAERPHPEGFVSQSGGPYVGDADTKDRVAEVRNAQDVRIGWDYVDGSNDSVERYDPTGRLTSVTTRAGAVFALAYNSSGRLHRVTDPYQRYLQFSYDEQGRIQQLTGPAGAAYDYGYDAAGNLITVTHPPNMLGVRATRTYHYENSEFPSFLTGITDENGWRYATYTYTGAYVTESRHNATAIQTANRYTFTYSPFGGPTTVVDPLGASRVHSFAAVLAAYRDAGVSQPCPSCGSVSSAQTYDTNANVASRTDFNGKKTCYAYDLTRNLETARVEGLVASENCAASLASPPNRSDVRKVTTTWHPTFRLPATITEPAPGGTRTITLTYNPATGGLLNRTTVALKNDGTSATITRSQSWTYAARGRVQTATDPNGWVTQYTYYADDDADLGKRGNLHTVTNPLGHVTTVTAYDLNGRPTAITDANGVVTTMTYDPRGRLVVRTVAGEMTTYAYDGVGQLTLVTLPDASTLSYLYDGAHRLTEIRDGLGNKIVYTLDGMGNRIAENVYDHAGVLKRTRSRVFNALNRLERELGALGQTTQYGYDANGNLTSVTDPLNHQTVNTFDALNRLVKVTDRGQGNTQYTYDDTGLLRQVNDPRDLATIYLYDGLGNQTKLASPDTGEATQTFDAAGNVLTRLDARGVTATYIYDFLNRPTSVVFSKAGAPSEAHAFEYDGLTTGTTNAKGRLTKVTDRSGEIRISYTPHGRVTTRIQLAGGTSLALTYTYNSAGQLGQITTPSGQQISFGYLNNRVSAITVNGQTLLSGAVSLPFAQMAAWQWGNNHFTFRRHDTDGRFENWEFRNGATVLRKDFTYDTASRITGIADSLQPNQSTGYGYDALNRLTSAQLGAPLVTTRQYGYDAVGNRSSATTDGQSATLTSGLTSNQLVALSGGPPAGLPVGENLRTFTYNLANRLASVGNGTTTIASYAVNALGQRVAKTVGGTTTRFVYDESGRLIGEYAANGALIQETIWLEDLPVATLRSTGAGGSPTPINVYYVHADQLGSPRAITRPADNAMIWRWDNTDPFGNNAANDNPAGAGTFSFGMRFPGQYYDVETGLHYNYFRDYDPSIGRYLTPDPMQLAGGLNLYLYADSRPIEQVDPEGLTSKTPPHNWPGPIPPKPHGGKPPKYPAAAPPDTCPTEWGDFIRLCNWGRAQCQIVFKAVERTLCFGEWDAWCKKCADEAACFAPRKKWFGQG